MGIARAVMTGAISLVVGAVTVLADPPRISGDATIRGSAGGSEIVIRTTSRFAGAIDSLIWNGREFIDRADHGRQLQSASNFDAGTPLSNETFNPTEAGSQWDGTGPTSTSRLLQVIAKDRQLQTTTQMAFWLRPNDKANGQPAKNSQVLSDHLLTKRVQIGYGKLAHAIRYDVTFSLPVGERHNHAVFEAVTGYMPAEFEVFWKYNSDTGDLERLDDGPGEQSDPVVLATASGEYAMGIFSPDQPSHLCDHVGYGRFRFPNDNVVKWNCVFRRDDPSGISAGEYSFRNFVVIGDLADIKTTMRQLRQEFSTPRSPARP